MYGILKDDHQLPTKDADIDVLLTFNILCHWYWYFCVYVTSPACSKMIKSDKKGWEIIQTEYFTGFRIRWVINLVLQMNSLISYQLGR